MTGNRCLLSNTEGCDAMLRKGYITESRAQSLGCARDSILWLKFEKKLFPVSFRNVLAVNKGMKAESGSFGVLGIVYT